MDTPIVEPKERDVLPLSNISKEALKAIKEGLEEEGFNKDNLYIINDVKESYKMIQNFKTDKDIYALYENDLPDTYVEKGDKK